MCREGYFGPDCGCSPRDDSTGHFTCDTNGTKVCLSYQNPETNCVEEGTTTEPLTTNNQADTETTDTNTEAATPESTSNSDVCPSAACTDIVPIVAGGVAGGLVVLVLILIVNIVLVVAYVKVKFMKHYSNKQGML